MHHAGGHAPRANVHDGKQMFETAGAVGSSRGRPRRPRELPKKMQADKAYDGRALRWQLRRCVVLVEDDARPNTPPSSS